jgi:hypothetical protein
MKDYRYALVYPLEHTSRHRQGPSAAIAYTRMSIPTVYASRFEAGARRRESGRRRRYDWCSLVGGPTWQSQSREAPECCSWQFGLS